MSEQARITKIVVGPLEVNCYILACRDSGQAAVIDPGAEPERIIRLIDRMNVTPRIILNTHGHLDHVSANASLAERFQIPVRIHAADLFLLEPGLSPELEQILDARPSPVPDCHLEDGEMIPIGNLFIRVIHTPGHTPGSVCLLVGDDCFCGDTVFAGSVGRTDLLGGDEQMLQRSIADRLVILPDRTRLLPGHGPETTVGEEKQTNPFF